jgi:mono/diheme cytochrome c family protein
VKRWAKRTGLVLAGVAVTALGAYALVAIKVSARLSQKFETHHIGLSLPAPDVEAIASGKHLVEARYGCQACHGQNLAGGVMIDDPAIGSVLGPNLTAGKGSRVNGYDMADWDRIVRHGVKPDGTGALMPSEDFFKMSDTELADIVAFIRSVPAVDAEVPGPKLGPVGKVLVALGKLPISAERQPDPSAEHPAEPPRTAESTEFGAHLAATCVGCHRTNLAGGPMAFGPPDWPAAANLTPHASGLGGWSYAEFERALTEGASKDGHQLREPMAGVVLGTKAMSPTERKALWAYLRSLEPTSTNDG